jgi:hypothetical protein
VCVCRGTTASWLCQTLPPTRSMADMRASWARASSKRKQHVFCSASPLLEASPHAHTRTHTRAPTRVSATKIFQIRTKNGLCHAKVGVHCSSADEPMRGYRLASTTSKRVNSGIRARATRVGRLHIGVGRVVEDAVCARRSQDSVCVEKSVSLSLTLRKTFSSSDAACHIHPRIDGSNSVLHLATSRSLRSHQATTPTACYKVQSRLRHRHHPPFPATSFFEKGH